MIRRFADSHLRAKLAAFAVLVALAAVASLVIPGLAGAISAPSISSPASGTTVGAGSRTITFAMPADDSTEDGYILWRAPANGGPCSAARATAVNISSHTGTAPLAPAPLVDSSTPVSDTYCYWVQANDSSMPGPAGSEDSAPIQLIYDVTPPVVSITSNPVDPTQASGATFDFTVDDGTVQCKLDAGSFTSCATGVSYTSLGQGSHTFTVRSTDSVNNVGTASYSWMVDRTPPTVVITTGSKPADPTSGQTANFTFSGIEGTPQCKLDVAGSPGASFGPCTTTGSMDYNALVEGTYTFTVESADAATNVGTATYTWVVDRTPPAVTISGGKPADPTNVQSASFAFTASDGSVQCKLDVNGAPGTFGACTSPKSYSSLADGSYTFVVRSSDAAGNVGSDTFTWTVDRAPPVVALTTKPAAATTATDATFAFTGAEGTIECKLDSAAFVPCATGTGMDYTGLSEASHTFTVRSTDAASNVGTASWTWTVDHSPPSVPGTFGSTNQLPSHQPQFFYSSSTDGNYAPNTLTYRLYKDGAFTGVTGPSPITDTSMLTNGSGDGTFTYTLRAVDPLLNESADSPSVSITIDAGPPSVPLNVHSSAPFTRNAPGISWNASTGSPSEYRVFRNGTQIGTVGSSITTFSDPLPLDGSADGDYTYTVKAADVSNNASAASTPLHIVLDTTRPAPSAGLTAAQSPTAAKPALVWPASASGDVAGYNVYRGTALVNGAPIAGTSFVDAGLSGDGTYVYSVRTVDRAGNESADSVATSVLYDTTAPGAPGASATAAASGGTSTVSWSASTDAGSGVIAYQVRRSVPNGGAPGSLAEGTPVCGSLPASGLGCGDAGLTPGASFRYAVFAIDAVGNVSAAGKTASIAIPSTVDRTPPKPVTALKAVVANGQISLSWKNPAADLATVDVVLNAKRAPRSAADGSTVYHGSGTKVHLKLPKLSAGALVRFAVFALDTAGNVSIAARATVTVPKPSAVSLAPNGKLSGSPNLTWNAVTGATYYNVQVFEGKQAARRIGISWPTVTKWVLPGKQMKKGKVYTWYVWPGIGAKAAARYGKLIGKVTFTYTG